MDGDRLRLRLFVVSEICAVSKVSKKEIGRCFKLIKRAVETKVGQVESTDFMVRPSICSHGNQQITDRMLSCFSLGFVLTSALAPTFNELQCTLQRRQMN